MKLTHQESCWTGSIFFSLWHRQSRWLVFLFPLRPWLHTSWWIRATAISFPLLVFWTGFGWIRATAIFHYTSMGNPSQSYYPGAAADPLAIMMGAVETSYRGDEVGGHFLCSNPKQLSDKYNTSVTTYLISTIIHTVRSRSYYYPQPLLSTQPVTIIHTVRSLSYCILHAAVIINSTGDHHPHSPVTILILPVVILSQKVTATEKLNRWPSSTQSGHYPIITSKKNLNPHLTCLRGNSFTSVRQNMAEK